MRTGFLSIGLPVVTSEIGSIVIVSTLVSVHHHHCIPVQLVEANPLVGHTRSSICPRAIERCLVVGQQERDHARLDKGVAFVFWHEVSVLRADETRTTSRSGMHPKLTKGII